MYHVVCQIPWHNYYIHLCLLHSYHESPKDLAYIILCMVLEILRLRIKNVISTENILVILKCRKHTGIVDRELFISWGGGAFNVNHSPEGYQIDS